MPDSSEFVLWLEDLSNDDVARVGGKNASLGEMIRVLSEQGVRVPGGFATTAHAYRTYLEANDLRGLLEEQLAALERGDRPLSEVGQTIREAIAGGEFPPGMERAIVDAYGSLSARYDRSDVDVAVRSSATAEDLPTASFAGQQETFLNVRGTDELREAVRGCLASLFTDRAIFYRQQKGFEHMQVALSVGVQKMVRSDRACAGVLFTLEPESGFRDVVVIDGAWGLGEVVVQGTVSPDEFMVYKPLLDRAGACPIVKRERGQKAEKLIYGEDGRGTKSVETSPEERAAYVLTDAEILQLARWGRIIEDHYDRPMDIEWARDGESGELFIVQARPETVQSQQSEEVFETYEMKGSGERLLEGLSVGNAIATGEACPIGDAGEIDRFREGSVLVTRMTQPDWVPIMKKARAIVTAEGGRTCHAAIVSRELGIPAVVGAEGALEVLEDGRAITISCAEGDRGYVYEGRLEYEVVEHDLSDIPDTETDVMINMASPESALRWWKLPVDGIGLARMEFIINDTIKVHPMALIHGDRVEDPEVLRRIEELTRGYDSPPDFFVDQLSTGIARIAASQYPRPVLVRMSDFKSNEYASLLGGETFESVEENPMLGFRGAARYTSERYREGFALECRAIRRVREEIGLDNVIVMIPFCRTLTEADRVLAIMEEQGLRRGEEGLKVFVMAELPANVVLAGEFADRFDGFSIGSNDLTQLVLGVDRDSSDLAYLFDERDPAVQAMIGSLLETAHGKGSYVGICGQGPSDHPEFAEFLVRRGIDSISLNPDSVVEVKKRIAELEKTL